MAFLVYTGYNAHNTKRMLTCWEYSSYNVSDRNDKVVFNLSIGRIHAEKSGMFRRGNDYYTPLPGEKCSIMKID